MGREEGGDGISRADDKTLPAREGVGGGGMGREGGGDGISRADDNMLPAREGVGGGDGISRADDNTLPAREGGRGWHQPGRRRCACCALFVSLGFTLFSTSD